MNISFCLCGLGNPKKEYFFTRHNVGYMFVDYFKDYMGGTEWKNFLNKVEYSMFDIRNSKIALVKPIEYMNNSGKSIKSFCQYFSINYDKLIMIYDDVDIELGAWRIRKKGSAGTHNGMKSVISEFGIEDIARIRIGIGPKPKLVDLAKFVLSPFKSDEKKKLEDIFIEIKDIVQIIFEKGIDYAISKYNRKL